MATTKNKAATGTKTSSKSNTTKKKTTSTNKVAAKAKYQMKISSVYPKHDDPSVIFVFENCDDPGVQSRMISVGFNFGKTEVTSMRLCVGFVSVVDPEYKSKYPEFDELSVTGKQIRDMISSEYAKVKNIAFNLLKERINDNNVKIIELNPEEENRFIDTVTIEIIRTMIAVPMAGYTDKAESFISTNTGKPIMKFAEYMLNHITEKPMPKSMVEGKKKSARFEQMHGVRRMIADALIFANISPKDKYLRITFGLTADFDETYGLYNLDVRLDPKMSPSTFVIRMYYAAQNLFDRSGEQIISSEFFDKLDRQGIIIRYATRQLSLYLVGLLGAININHATDEVSVDEYVKSAIIDTGFNESVPRPIGIYIDSASIIRK